MDQSAFCSCSSLDPYLAIEENLFNDCDDRRLAQFMQLVDSCLMKGVGFDRFFIEYVDAEGRKVYWNPFWRYGSRYTPAELFMQLRVRGFGFVPEAAVNVFLQLREQRLLIAAFVDASQYSFLANKTSLREDSSNAI